MAGRPPHGRDGRLWSGAQTRSRLRCSTWNTVFGSLERVGLQISLNVSASSPLLASSRACSGPPIPCVRTDVASAGGRWWRSPHHRIDRPDGGHRQFGPLASSIDHAHQQREVPGSAATDFAGKIKQSHGALFDQLWIGSFSIGICLTSEPVAGLASRLPVLRADDVDGCPSSRSTSTQ